MEEQPIEKLARVLREILGSRGAHDTEIALLLLFFGTLVIFWLLFISISNPREKKTPKKDLDFFNSVIYQKGLETFDSNLLLEIAETYEITPVYRILLDEHIFDRILAKMRDDLERKRGNPRIISKREYVSKLKARLFPVS